MLTWIRTKFDALRLRYLTRKNLVLKAELAIAENPYVIKRAQRKLNRRFFSKWTLRAAFAVAVSGVTAAVPDMVSTPLDQHARASGVDASLQQHFATQNIRVYHRRNPLVPFHLAGQTARMAWESNSTALGRTIAVPSNYISGLLVGFSGVLFGHPLDAYSLSDTKPHNVRQCFIRPPAALDSGILFETLTHMNVDVQVPADAAQSRYYYTLIMAHEARHCDQDKDMRASPLNEIDADVFADRLTAQDGLNGGLNAQDRAGERSYWAALRLVNAVVGHDVGHYSTPALLRGGITPLQAIDDSAAVRRLVQVIVDAEHMNKDVFPSGMEVIERRYHLALALLADPQAGDAQLRDKAALYVRAVNYLDELASIDVVGTRHGDIAPRLNMAWLTQEYAPTAPATPVRATQRRTAS